MLLEISGEITPERMKGWSQSKNNTQFHSAGDQPWDFFGRNDAEAETPVLWPPYEKNSMCFTVVLVGYPF